MKSCLLINMVEVIHSIVLNMFEFTTSSSGDLSVSSASKLHSYSSSLIPSKTDFVQQSIGIAVDRVEEVLQSLEKDSGLKKKFDLAFGKTWDQDAAQQMTKRWAEGDFSDLPSIEIIDGKRLNGSVAAFSESTNTIYMSRQFVAKNAQNSDPLTGISGVLLEEVGHYIDSKINSKEAPGDEGEIFKHVILNQDLSAGELVPLKAEDDTTRVMLNGKKTTLELSSPSSFGVNLGSVHYTSSGNKFVAANRTGGTYLWCTDYAYGRAMEKGFFRNHQGLGARISGNAGMWDDQAGSWGRQAAANSIVVWDANQGGAGSVGHVGFVERVNSDGSFVISEANWGSARMSFNSRTILPGSAAFTTAKFIYLSGATTTQPPIPPSSSTFRGTVDGALNVRSGPGTNNSIVGSLSVGNSRVFDAVVRGSSHWDAREQRNDDRWFRIQGTNQWVSAAFITGNPVFTGTVDQALNVRSGPGTNNAIVSSLNTGSTVTFDATTTGTTHWDAREGRNENRWFRIQGTDRWVSAAFITGNPSY